MNELSGKSVVITGASKGIGAETAKLLAKSGVKVVLAARSSDLINDIAQSIRNEGGEAIAIACDVSNYNSVQSVVDKCVQNFGTLDVFIGNAGVIDPIAPLILSSPDSWSETIDINLKGIYNGLRASLPVMQKQKFGTIINVSSGAASFPLEGWSHYCAAKAGVAMLTSCAHLEHRGDNIRIFGLSPGTVATYMQVAIKASGINAVSQLDPSVHVPADWPAKAMAWMCTKDADEFVGQEISLREENIRKRVGLI